MSHTQGKIKFRKGKKKEYEHDFIITGNRGSLVAAYSPFEYAASAKMIETHNANARRLVACWNACDGISTEELEAGLSAGLIRTVRAKNAVARQRDELLAALIAISDPMKLESHGDPTVLRDFARAAIAKAGGNHEQP